MAWLVYSRRAEKLLKLACVISAGCFALACIALILNRWSYPFHISLIEGATVLQVNKLSMGLPLYAEPTIEHISFTYQPLYYYLVAGSAWLFEESLGAYRLVSITALLATCGLIFWQVLRTSPKSFLPATLALGAFLATYGEVRGFFELARVDMLLTAFLLAGFCTLWGRNRTNAIYAGVLFSAAFMTKQTALIALLPLTIQMLLWDRARLLLMLTTMAVVLGVCFYQLSDATAGWYRYYVFDLPANHRGRIDFQVLAFWLDHVRPIALGLIFAGIALLMPSRTAGESRQQGLLAAALVGLFGISWAAMINPGANANVLLPAYAGWALLLGIGMARFYRWLSENGMEQEHRSLWGAMSLVLVLAQLGFLIYDPRPYRMNADDEKAGQTVLSTLDSLGDRVFLPNHNYLSVMNNKQPLFNWIAVSEISGLYGVADKPTLKRLEQSFYKAITQGSVSYAVLGDSMTPTRIQKRFPKVEFELVDIVEFKNDRVFKPINGDHRPSNIYKLSVNR